MEEKTIEQQQIPSTEGKKSKRDMLKERLSKKYPDKSFDDDETFAGQISDDYDNYDKELDEYKKSEQALSDMFTSDPRSASFLVDWKESGDPVVALVRRFGTDIADAVNDPERLEEMKKANQEYLDRVAKNKESEEKYKKNLKESLKAISDAQEQNGWSDEQVDSAMQNLFKILDDAIDGDIAPETLQMMMNAQNYDQDVASAQREGEVRGRNAKIEEKLRKADGGDGVGHLEGKNGTVRRAPSRQSIFELASQA